jgi:hypothetical protein
MEQTYFTYAFEYAFYPVENYIIYFWKYSLFRLNFLIGWDMILIK